MADVDCDVLVVGYGPVGQMLAILLAQHGHQVGVVERWAESYPRPRAVHFDDEIARVLAAAGLGDDLPVISEPSAEYDWQNEDGHTLLHFDWGAVGPSGWPTANMFSQPALEAVLVARAASFPTVAVHRGQLAVELVEHDDHVEVGLRDAAAGRATLCARYVVGCDGANSFVRGQMATGVTDLGFFYDWLIVDTIPHAQREWKPANLQMCHPSRPTTVVSGGPGRRRWEFMRLPDETAEELNTESTAWRLLAPWNLTPDNAVLERHTVYTFQARWANQWRTGRVMIAGDAAHLMPPFAGQGMCSGIRDAANLAWKLDLVLTDRARDVLLDTYSSERAAHVRHAIGMSVELGNVICLTDPGEVAARDEIMLKAEGRPEVALPAVPPPVLGPGVSHTDAGGHPVAPAGELSPQARVADRSGVVGRFDEVFGTGFFVTSAVDLSAVLTPAVLDVLQLLRARVVTFVEPGAEVAVPSPVEVAVDVDGFYLPFMRDAGHEVLIVRPDFYFFGAAGDAAQLPALLEELCTKLSLVR
ncbi:bifunctional 3-(3-hydroxy-phenyl)propionate/3-hydroxycinnamic acid hydroxylase [uncultured Jatrophihabitans sp.]|uniref:bifunctional 3-(3-hydroxy-phenyl)propionate/3-hydroxycinnamic acid hydroxylase MhpA n=1 Tax=uncultured Jatrophihabitans sp. TaxID=1610747 RepID=UPI0035CB58C5